MCLGYTGVWREYVDKMVPNAEFFTRATRSSDKDYANCVRLLVSKMKKGDVLDG